MATYSGRNARIAVNGALITEMGSWSIDRSADEIDTAAFGDGWKKSDVGMKGWSGSMDGFYDPADTTGQQVLEDAYQNGTLIQDIKFYIKYSTTSGETIRYLTPDTTSDPDAGLRITSLNVSIDKAGVAQLSASFSGSGPIKVVEETVA